MIEVKEKRVDHVFRHRRKGQLSQTAALNPHGGVKIDPHRRYRHVQDLDRRRQEATRLLRNHSRGYREHLRYCRVVRVTAGDFVPLGVPGLRAGGFVILILGDPGLGSWNQLIEAIDGLVNQARFFGFGRRHALAFDEVFVRGHQPHQVNGLHHATATGQQSECHLGEAQLHRFVVPGDAVVAGQRQL